MITLRILNHGQPAGLLTYNENDKTYLFSYDEHYCGAPISLTMPISKQPLHYDKLPAFFEGLLPEGIMLAAMLRLYKLDELDFMGQLRQVGKDVVGSVTIEEII